jgi:hypothetical protein
MDPDIVLRKTAKGREEIDKRTFRVDSRRRTLLILVDGQSTAAALAAKAGHIADPLASLQSLWSEGFVEPQAGAQAAQPQVAPPADTSTESLDQLKRRASASIGRLMGPDGDGLALKLERAASRAEFVAEASRARDALRAFLGPRKADEFWNSLGM